MTGQDIDYEALAKQHGAISSAPASKISGTDGLDYAALAKQHGALSSAPAPAPKAPEQEGFFHSLASVFGLPTNAEEAKQAITQKLAHVGALAQSGDLLNPAAHLFGTPQELHPQVVAGVKQTAEEAAAADEALKRGDITGAAAHTIGSAGYGASTLLTPIGGSSMQKAGEQFGQGNVRGGLGTTTGLIAPIAIGGMRGKAPAPAAEVLPKHVEALTGLIEDKAGTVDPHATATEALPHLRETAVRMKIDPSKLEGRAAGQQTLKIAEQSVKDAQNEFDTIRTPYNAVLVDRTPMARVYREAITPDLLENEPKVAAALEAQAKKFEQPAPLEQVNQFRKRMNNRLDAFERKGTSQQLMDDVQTRADAAAADEARNIEYETVGKLSGLDPEYVRALKQREGALIEAKRSLTKEYNRASGAQGEAESKTIREKVANTYPSPRGVKHAGIRELIGPKPIEVLNSRIQRMFADMGEAQALPSYEQVQPPSAPQIEGGPSGPVPSGEAPAAAAATAERGIKPPQQRTFLRTTQQDVKDYYNYRFDQLRSELKSAETPEARADVQRRMAELDQTQRTHPTSEGVVQNGQITQAHVNAENAFYTQARAELGANASASDVLKRAQALKVEHAAKGAPPPVTPANPPKPPTLTQKVQAQPLPQLRQVTPPLKVPRASAESPAGASPQAQAAFIMLQAKQGLISPAEADSRIQKLVGSSGRRTIRRPVAPE